jgi:hypothetical protein
VASPIAGIKLAKVGVDRRRKNFPVKAASQTRRAIRPSQLAAVPAGNSRGKSFLCFWIIGQHDSPPMVGCRGLITFRRMRPENRPPFEKGSPKHYPRNSQITPGIPPKPFPRITPGVSALAVCCQFTSGQILYRPEMAGDEANGSG